MTIGVDIAADLESRLLELARLGGASLSEVLDQWGLAPPPVT